MRFILLIILSGILPGHLHARILMKPWLQATTAYSAWVMVECDSRAAVTVWFGQSKTEGTTILTSEIRQTSKPTFVHAIHLSGLSPATRYYYSVSQDTMVTPFFSFYTAVPPGMPFRFAWAADNRTGTDVFRTISGLIKKADPMMLLFGGDLCKNGSYDYWKSEFFIDEFQSLASKVPFFNTPGNHEGWQINARAFTRSPESASGTQDYYSFDSGDLHVLSLNQELPYGSGSAQYEFARQDLAASKAVWKLVMVHTPAYCGGAHGENADMIKLTSQLLEPAGVDLVLAGHSHFYQHNKVNGIVHLVVGSAGAPLRKPAMKPYTVKQAHAYNFAIIDVSSTKLKIFVYNEANEILDFITLEKPVKE